MGALTAESRAARSRRWRAGQADVPAGARHDCADGNSLDADSQVFLRIDHERFPNQFVRRLPGSGKHLRDTFFRRQNNGQTIGPPALEKETLQVLFGVGSNGCRWGMGRTTARFLLSSAV